MSLRQFTPPPLAIPFSHRPGIRVWLGGVVVHLFSTAFEIEGKVHTLPGLGVPTKWTVYMSNRHIEVEGYGKDGFFRYRLYIEDKSLIFRACKGVPQMERGENKVLAFIAPYEPQESRLLLGCHRAPYFDRIQLKPDILEVLQLWYQVSRPDVGIKVEPSILLDLVHLVEKRERALVLPQLEVLFRAGITDFFVPKQIDDLYLGYEQVIFPEPSEAHKVVVACIRALFLQEQSEYIKLLPCLPKECLSGRLLREHLSSGHSIDIEWRKHAVRRVIIHAACDDCIRLSSPHMSQCYVRPLPLRLRKKKYTLGEPLELKAGTRYLLDHWE